MIKTCYLCGRQRSNGVWCAEETMDGKAWGYMGEAKNSVLDSSIL